jgi:MFS family permease
MFAVSLYVCFLDNANQLIQKRFCYTQASAGRTISIVYIVAACCSAPLGFLIDKVGHRRYFSIACMVIFTVAHFIIYVYPQCAENTINNSFSGASVGLFLIGVGYCFYANSIVPSIPLIVKKKVTGTAFGIMQMI